MPAPASNSNARLPAPQRLSSKRGWKEFEEIEFEINKMSGICEGIDNMENINTHYEKIKIDFFKNKLITQLLISSQSNSQRQLSSNNLISCYPCEAESPAQQAYPQRKVQSQPQQQ